MQVSERIGSFAVATPVPASGPAPDAPQNKARPASCDGVDAPVAADSPAKKAELDANRVKQAADVSPANDAAMLEGLLKDNQVTKQGQNKPSILDQLDAPAWRDHKDMTVQLAGAIGKSVALRAVALAANGNAGLRGPARPRERGTAADRGAAEAARVPGGERAGVSAG